MKVNSKILTVSIAFVILSILNSQYSSALAQGTAFTYQGRLNDSGSAANGIYDLRFGIYDASTGGNQAGNFITNSAVGVTNGLFTTTLNFGGIFTGTNYWLDIGVRTNGASAFTALTSRQPLTPIPYAIQANNANVANSLPALQIQQNSDGAPNIIGGSPLNFVSPGSKARRLPEVAPRIFSEATPTLLKDILERSVVAVATLFLPSKQQ